MNEAGARDGILKIFDCFVDGMPFDVSLKVLGEIRAASISMDGNNAPDSNNND